MFIPVYAPTSEVRTDIAGSSFVLNREIIVFLTIYRYSATNPFVILPTDTLSDHFCRSQQTKVLYRMTTTKENDLFACINDSQQFSQDYLLQRYRDTGFLWQRSQTKQPIHATHVLSFLDQHADACRKHWSVENRGDYDTEEELMDPTKIQDLKQAYYVSTVINKSEQHALTALVELTPPPPFLSAIHNGGAWLFIGKTVSENTKEKEEKKKKRKRFSLIGRAEHVDDVTHSGTWHYQLSGEKVWYIRPNKDLWDLGDLPDISTHMTLAERTDKGTWRLKVHVKEGDLFVLNTRIWFHCTELDEQTDWSISVARDFYLPLSCPQNISKGTIILEEEDIPTDIPRSDTPNCTLAEIDDDTGELSIVLIATSFIPKGETLYIAEDNIEGEYNGDEVVDPRAIAAKDFVEGDVVLRGDAIPDDLPRALDPTCALILNDDDDEAVLRALGTIRIGQVFSILPDDNEDYEEVEVDLETGEIMRVDADKNHK